MSPGPRRANREGTFRHRADGRWEGRVLLSGIRYSRFGRTDAEAREKIRNLVADHDRGMAPLDAKVTVGAWLGEWLETYVRPVSRPRTASSYADVVKLHLVPAIGQVGLARLSPDHVQRMLNMLTASRRKQGDEWVASYSPTTVRYVYAVLNIALGRAVKTGRLHRNVARLVDPPAKASPEVRPLSEAERGVLLEAIRGSRHEALIVLALATGMRQGELLGLTWPDVDLESGTLVVRRQLERGTGRLVALKTERSLRNLQLPTLAQSALRSHRAKQNLERVGVKGWDQRDFVFTTKAGTPLDPSKVVRAFQATLADAGLPKSRFHDLRHAFATTLLAEGEELAVVSKLLGHSGLGTTADVYGHLTPRMRQRAAQRMDQALRRKAT